MSKHDIYKKMQLPNICVIALEQIQRTVQVDFFAHF